MSENSGSTNTAEKNPDGLVGKVLANRYTLAQPVGEGGMGVVYLADQIGLDRKVVVKVLNADANVPDAEARFNREAKTLSRLQHPNIVGIHDFGIDGPLHYLVMEYVEGRTLAWFLRKTGPLNLVVFARIANQMLEAVGEAHRVGLIHRDLKPANIMLCRRGDNPLHVKVLDFGLSKLAEADTLLTRPKHILGSAGYMAPEQIKGLTVDQRSDVYALGVIFFRMLTGKAAYDGADQMAVLYKHVHEAVPSISDFLPEGHDIPQSVMDVVEQCMAKEPSERYPSALEAGAALRAAMPSSAVFRAPLGQLPTLARSNTNTTGWLTMSDSFEGKLTPAGGVPRRSSAKTIDRTQSQSGSHSASQVNTSGGSSTNTAIVGAFGVTALLLIAAIGVVGLGLIVYVNQPVQPVVVVPADVTDEVSEEQIRGATLRAEGLSALEGGNYEAAVQKLTEALKFDPDRTGDTTDLLKIAMEMRTAAASAPAAAPAATPAAVAVVDVTPKKVEPPKKKPPGTVAREVEPEPTPAPASEPVIARGTLLVTSSPSGLAFEVAGHGGAVTPARMEVPAGSVSVTFFHEGAARETRVETVNANSVRVVDYKAPVQEPKPAVTAPAPVVVSTPPVVPAPTPSVTTPPKPVVATTTTAPPAAVAKLGELLIESPNLYGEVWVNGVKVGFPPIVAKKIPAGMATIEVRVGGTARRTKTIEVVEGQRVTVHL